ncbi:MAG: carbon storage regulator CsrA [Eubacteriales bacterium]|jgi:carbon storage regulator|nr:carbon storage regulator CsrA [Eubacteriales bacterium]MDD3290305.1 carbon storage regulator CsrA [Eubacteriales bacterium]MDD3863257.1 carbon storage regulator CsrA [Eubacteriales bacterium]MDD4444706.1 carbon storage regulator CsrA [Eubacteriales bacterium]
MLVISRKTGESLTISDNIKITVVSMGNDKVVLGIDAPKEIKIMREELLETIQANQAATQTHGADDLNKIASFIKRNKND